MDSDFSGTSITEYIQRIVELNNGRMELYWGTVIQTNPIRIQLVDPKITLGQYDLLIPETFRDHSVSATFNSTSGTLKINAGLKKDDKVIVLSFGDSGNMKSIVIDRK